MLVATQFESDMFKSRSLCNKSPPTQLQLYDRESTKYMADML